MVRKGKLSVELVDASTRPYKPFKEYRKNRKGKVHVEVEPGADYFVRVTSEYVRPVQFETWIDGRHIGYIKIVKQGSACIGLWLQQKNISTESSLKFGKLGQVLAGENSNSSPPVTGEIKVKVYKAINPNEKDRKSDIISSWTEQDSKISLEKRVDSKKYLKSNHGDVSKVKIYPSKSTYTSYTKGDLIETFELRYCTTVGLIHVGVLKKPPTWAYAKLMRPYKKHESDETNIKPQILSSKLTTSDGALLEQKEVEVYDLTALESSDDGESDSGEEKEHDGGIDVGYDMD